MLVKGCFNNHRQKTRNIFGFCLSSLYAKVTTPQFDGSAGESILQSRIQHHLRRNNHSLLITEQNFNKMLIKHYTEK